MKAYFGLLRVVFHEVEVGALRHPNEGGKQDDRHHDRNKSGDVDGQVGADHVDHQQPQHNAHRTHRRQQPPDLRLGYLPQVHGHGREGDAVGGAGDEPPHEYQHRRLSEADHQPGGDEGERGEYDHLLATEVVDHQTGDGGAEDGADQGYNGYPRSLLAADVECVVAAEEDRQGWGWPAVVHFAAHYSEVCCKK